MSGNRRERGNLIVVSAPSGAGKSSLVDMVLARVAATRYSISYTTRKARGAEKHGIDYYFVTEDEFLTRRDRNEFLEYAEVHGHLYGTSKLAIEEIVREGYDAILDIDVQGARQIYKQMPEAITVFILPPSREALESRLRTRNLNEPADLERRLRNAAAEVGLYKEFNYVIVNDNLESASATLEDIIHAERHRPARQRFQAEAIIKTFGGK